MHMKKKKQFMVLQRGLGSNRLFWFVPIIGDAHSCADDRLDFHFVVLAPPLVLFLLGNFCIKICTTYKNGIRKKVRHNIR